MLEIRINKSFYLNLPDNFEMPFIDENPMFLTDRIPVPHTISLNAPLTPENKAFFGFPDRVTSSRLFDKYTAEIIHFGNVIMRGELIILSVKKTIQFQFISAFMPSTAKNKLNTIDFGDFDYGHLQAEPADLNYADPMYDDYYQALYDSIHNPSGFLTAPVRLSDVEWEGHAATGGLKNAIRQYINYYNPIDETWSMPPKDGQGSMCIFPIIPFPYIHNVISAFFGDTLISNPFYDDPTLRKLVMVCFNHKNKNIDNYYTVSENGRTYYVYPLVDDYTVQEDGFINNYVQQKSFLQEYPFNDFFKNLLALFGLTCFIGEKIELVYNSSLLNTKTIFDLSPFISGDPEIFSEKKKKFVLTYGENTIEDTSGIDHPIVKPSIRSMYEQILNVISPNLTQNFRLSGTNAIYEFSKTAVGVPATGQIQRLEVRSVIKQGALTTPKIVENDDVENIELKIDVKPLEMNLELFWNELSNYDEEAINKENWFVPVMSSPDLSSPPFIMIDAGLKAAVSNNEYAHRQLINHHTDAYGNTISNLSLLINENDTDGVFYKFHRTMAQWYAKDKKILSAIAILTPSQIQSISNKHKVHVNGRNFHIMKREYSLSAKKAIPVTFTLIEAIN